MNTLKIYAAIILTTMGFSCTSAPVKKGQVGKRIILVERTVVDGYLMYIIEVDGKEFLINGSGGIQALTKQ